jgi:rod shape-determining protein MreC
MVSSGGGIRRRYVLLLLVLTAITLITLDQQHDEKGPIGALGRTADEVVGPIRRATHRVAAPVGDWFGGIGRAGTLERRNKDLRAALATERARNITARNALAENRELKVFSGLPYLEGIERATAAVVQGPTGNFERTVVIDKGSDAGIRVGLPVVAGGGLFGRVLTVSPRSAKVLLLTDARFSVSVLTTDGRDVALASGQGTSLLRLEFVERVAGSEPPDIVPGDSIVTSGRDDSRFPKGIPVGRITAVDKRADGTVPEARVRPVVDLGAVEYVQVLLWDPDLSPTTAAR